MENRVAMDDTRGKNTGGGIFNGRLHYEVGLVTFKKLAQELTLRLRTELIG